MRARRRHRNTSSVALALWLIFLLGVAKAATPNSVRSSSNKSITPVSTLNDTFGSLKNSVKNDRKAQSTLSEGIAKEKSDLNVQLNEKGQPNRLSPEFSFNNGAIQSYFVLVVVFAVSIVLAILLVETMRALVARFPFFKQTHSSFRKGTKGDNRNATVDQLQAALESIQNISAAIDRLSKHIPDSIDKMAESIDSSWVKLETNLRPIRQSTDKSLSQTSNIDGLPIAQPDLLRSVGGPDKLKTEAERAKDGPTLSQPVSGTMQPPPTRQLIKDVCEIYGLSYRKAESKTLEAMIDRVENSEFKRLLGSQMRKLQSVVPVLEGLRSRISEGRYDLEELDELESYLLGHNVNIVKPRIGGTNPMGCEQQAETDKTLNHKYKIGQITRVICPRIEYSGEFVQEGLVNVVRD